MSGKQKVPFLTELFGVANRARTGDPQNHNLML